MSGKIYDAVPVDGDDMNASMPLSHSSRRSRRRKLCKIFVLATIFAVLAKGACCLYKKRQQAKFEKFSLQDSDSAHGVVGFAKYHEGHDAGENSSEGDISSVHKSHDHQTHSRKRKSSGKSHKHSKSGKSHGKKSKKSGKSHSKKSKKSSKSHSKKSKKSSKSHKHSKSRNDEDSSSSNSSKSSSSTDSSRSSKSSSSSDASVSNIGSSSSELISALTSSSSLGVDEPLISYDYFDFDGSPDEDDAVTYYDYDDENGEPIFRHSTYQHDKEGNEDDKSMLEDIPSVLQETKDVSGFDAGEVAREDEEEADS